MRTAILVMALALAASVAEAKSFPSLNEFNNYSSRQMRHLPDVRVPLGIAISPRSVEGLSVVQLTLMKNSIFAQVGYVFKTPALSKYFASRSWYNPNRGYHPERLRSVDENNARIIGNELANAKRRPDHGGDESSYDGDDGYGYGNDPEDGGGYGYGYGDDGQESRHPSSQKGVSKDGVRGPKKNKHK